MQFGVFISCSVFLIAHQKLVNILFTAVCVLTEASNLSNDNAVSCNRDIILCVSRTPQSVISSEKLRKIQPILGELNLDVVSNYGAVGRLMARDTFNDRKCTFNLQQCQQVVSLGKYLFMTMSSPVKCHLITS